MEWWSWMVLGAVLLGAELLAIDLQFYLVFLGVSAALVGLAGFLGLVMPDWAQWIVFAVLSLIFFYTFRKSLYEKLRSGAEVLNTGLDGDTLSVVDDLSPGSEVRAEHRGSKWTVRNTGSSIIAAGARAKVVKVDGLTLHVEAD